jgi:hypothetical protein
MQINVQWAKPMQLKDGKKENMIYTYETENIPDAPGCYVFYNKYGSSITIFYIGKSMDIQSRLEGHKNNLKLMMGIKNYMKGNKYVMYATIKTRNKNDIQKSIDLVERNLIKHALSQGHDLFNIQGKIIKYDEITFLGTKETIEMFGKKMNIEK